MFLFHEFLLEIIVQLIFVKELGCPLENNSCGQGIPVFLKAGIFLYFCWHGVTLFLKAGYFCFPVFLGEK